MSNRKTKNVSRETNKFYSLENIKKTGATYNVIFGEYANGGFFSIPNWNCGGELANFWDKYWNENSIYKALKRKKASKIIALAIAEYMENKEN